MKQRFFTKYVKIFSKYHIIKLIKINCFLRVKYCIPQSLIICGLVYKTPTFAVQPKTY
jgi:hypothetical protein